MEVALTDSCGIEERKSTKIVNDAVKSLHNIPGKVSVHKNALITSTGLRISRLFLLPFSLFQACLEPMGLKNVFRRVCQRGGKNITLTKMIISYF